MQKISEISENLEGGISSSGSIHHKDSQVSQIIEPLNPYDEIIIRENEVFEALKLLKNDFLSSISAFKEEFSPPANQKKAKKTNSEAQEHHKFLLDTLMEFADPMLELHRNLSKDLLKRKTSILAGMKLFNSKASNIQPAHENYSKHCSSLLKSYAILMRHPNFKMYMERAEMSFKSSMDFQTLLYEIFRHPVNLQLIVQRLNKHCIAKDLVLESKETGQALTKLNEVNQKINEANSSNELKIFEIHERYSSMLATPILVANRLYLKCFKWKVLISRKPTKADVHVMSDLVLVVKHKKGGGIIAVANVGPETSVDDLKDQKSIFHLFRLRCKDKIVIFKAEDKQNREKSMDELKRLLLLKPQDQKPGLVSQRISSSTILTKSTEQSEGGESSNLEIDVTIIGTRERFYGSFKRHTEYLIKLVNTKKLSYQFSRRYSEFLSLRNHLISQDHFKSVKFPSIPPKVLLKFSASVLEIRQIQLEVFIFFLLKNKEVSKDKKVEEFFGINIARYFLIEESKEEAETKKTDLFETSFSDKSCLSGSVISRQVSVASSNLYGPGETITSKMKKDSEKKLESLKKEAPHLNEANSHVFVANVNICNVFDVSIKLSVTTRALEGVKLISEAIKLENWSDFRLQILENDGVLSEQNSWRFLTDEDFIFAPCSKEKQNKWGRIRPKPRKFNSEAPFKIDPSLNFNTSDLKFDSVAPESSLKDSQLPFFERKWENVEIDDNEKSKILQKFNSGENSNISFRKERDFLKRDKRPLVFENPSKKWQKTNEKDQESLKKRKKSFLKGFEKVKLRLVKFIYLKRDTEEKELENDRTRALIVIRSIIEGALKRKKKGEMSGGFDQNAHATLIAMTCLAFSTNLEEIFSLEEPEFEKYKFKNIEYFLPVFIYSAKTNGNWQNEASQALQDIIQRIKSSSLSYKQRDFQKIQSTLLKSLFSTLVEIYPQFGSRVYRVRPTKKTLELFKSHHSSDYCLFQVNIEGVVLSSEEGYNKLLDLNYSLIDSFELKTNALVIRETLSKKEYTLDNIMAFEIYELCLIYFELHQENRGSICFLPATEKPVI